MSDPVTVLEFWLDKVGPAGWYQQSDALDADITEQFGALWQAAHDGNLEHWVDGTTATMAYLIVTDQFPRNMFRNDPRAFATDPQARTAARLALEKGWDQDAPPPERQFFYMPFEHSEDPEDQALAVDCFTNRMDSADNLLHARAHQKIIQRFGRFPFRNDALGRISTPEEKEFMAKGAYASVVRSLQS